MAAFTITTPVNIDSLTGKTGGDTYTINGGQLTIDQDSRYGLNQATSTTLAAMTISATLGGGVRIDGRKVRLIPYSGGSGTVPVGGTVVSKGGASGKLIGVWSSLTAAPAAAGAAMPATGFIKIKQWNDVPYTAGALTGITASATGPDVVGWLEVVGDEAATCTVPRLGLFELLGEWYDLGLTTGVANQTVQLPTSGSLLYCPGVFIEKAPGTDDFEFYAAAGSQTAVAADIRAKVVWITTAGLVRIGNNGTVAAGYTPATGLKIRVGNVFCQNATTAARTANALPNATLATRYDFTTTGGGVIVMDKASLAWYPSCAQAFSVTLSNLGVLEQINVSEVAAPMTWSKVGVGQTAAQTQFALLMALCFAGGTFTDCHWSRATLAASGQYTNSLTDVEGFSFVEQRYTALSAKANATTGNVVATRAVGCTWTAPKLTAGRMVFVTCTRVSVAGASYCDVITGTTLTTAAQNSYVFEVSTNTSDYVFDGVDFHGLTNVQPYLGILNVAAASCANGKLRNVGTPAVALSVGSVNQSAYLFVIANGAAANGLKVQRCNIANTRTGLFTADNSSKGIVLENTSGDYADAPVISMLNTRLKGVGATPSLTAQVAVYGTHFYDVFTSATAGRIALAMNEATALTADQVLLSGGAAFTSAGGLFMPLVGQFAEFSMPYAALGHTALQNAAPVMAGGTIGNYTLTYQADTGAGFGASKALSAANLAAEVIDPAVGIRLRIRITTAVANAAAITSLYVLTTSTAAAQAASLYPLDTNTVTFTGLVPGSDMVVLAAGTSTILLAIDAIAGSSASFVYSGAQAVDVGFLKGGFVPLYIRNLALSTTDAFIPVAQSADRNYQ